MSFFIKRNLPLIVGDRSTLLALWIASMFELPYYTVSFRISIWTFWRKMKWIQAFWDW